MFDGPRQEDELEEGELKEDTEPTTPATVPTPAGPSHPDAQPPKSSAEALEALLTSIKCPLCSKAVFTSNALAAHLWYKSDAVHSTWRAQNAVCLTALTKAAKVHNQTPAQRKLLAEATEAKQQRCKPLSSCSAEEGKRRLTLAPTKLQKEQAEAEAKEQVAVGQLEAEVKPAKRKASELALHDEEQMQDVRPPRRRDHLIGGWGLAEEVDGLRAQLAEETQARQRAEQAQEEMRAAKRALLAQSEREAAAAAWRDAAGAADAMEVVDGDGFMARFLAFRQARS